MKIARIKNITRGIKSSLNRFISILFIVALGAGFMSGLAAASPDMYDTADEYIDNYNLYDIDVKSTIGLTDDDLEAIKSLESIDQVQGSVVFDMVLNQANGSDFTSRVYGILDDTSNTEINRLNLIEGRLPENDSECIIESVFGKYSGESVTVGDTLTLSETNTDYDTLEGYMSDTTLTVVGICQSPLCISIEGDSSNIGSGTINLNVYTRRSAFTCDFYTDVFITVRGALELNTFEDEYNDLISDVSDDIKSISEERISLRADDLRAAAQNTIDKLNQLIDTVGSIAVIQNSQSDTLDANKNETTEISDILPDSDSTSSSNLNNEIALETSADYDSAADLTASLKDQLKAANEYLDSIDDASWMIRTRDDLTGYNSYSSNVGKVSALAKIFPVFFFVVALLVALTTMSRLIEEKRLQIGTLKALGYSNGQIIFEYMLFSISASVLGCILGFGVGFRIFPYAINSAYSMMYTLPAISTPIRWDIVAWVAPVTIVSILLATLWSCWSEFRSMPAILMLPKSPAPGKRIWLEHIGFIWRRMSFTHKVTARNLFRYKKRFIMTIIGVAGCSALLLTGFGIKDSVNDIVDKQYGEIDKYDLIFVMDEEDALSDDSSLSKTLNDTDIISEYMSVSQETGKVYFGKEKQEINIFVPQDTDKFTDFTTLRTRNGHTSLSLSDGSIVLTEKLCEEMGINIGDCVTLEDSDGHQASVVVSAITENYVSSYAYLTPETYSECFSNEPEYTSLLCKLTADDDEEDADKTLELANDATSQIMTSSHILYGRSVASLKDTFSDSIRSINGVIYVLIIAAGLLCIVVLYNLINVNICERRKELATLRVLGFYKSETQNYIFRETNILSFLGALAGLILGIWLHSVVVKTIEVNHIMFGRDIKPLSYIIALGISVIFTLLVDLIMKRPINKTDMVEAMKAND